MKRNPREFDTVDKFKRERRALSPDHKPHQNRLLDKLSDAADVLFAQNVTVDYQSPPTPPTVRILPPVTSDENATFYNHEDERDIFVTQRDDSDFTSVDDNVIDSVSQFNARRALG